MPYTFSSDWMPPAPLQRYFGEDPLLCISTLQTRSERPTGAPGGHLTQRHISESPAPTPRGRERLLSYCWPGAGLNYSLPTGRCWLSYFDPACGRAEPRCYPALGAAHSLLVSHGERRLSQAAERGQVYIPSSHLL